LICVVSAVFYICAGREGFFWLCVCVVREFFQSRGSQLIWVLNTEPWEAFDCRIGAELESFAWRGLLCFWLQIEYSSRLDGPELLSIEHAGCGWS
jgi:hypothetical protein